jgi:GNAT superfamily N-acetyltransferase
MIRPARIEDSSALTQVIEDFGYHVEAAELDIVLKKHLNSPDRYAFVAEIHGTVVGAIGLQVIEYFHRDASMLRVTYISVMQEHRRQGIARRLMDSALSHAIEKGCDKLELTTGSHRSDEAHKFYESCGFIKYDGVRYVMKAARQQSGSSEPHTRPAGL